MIDPTAIVDPGAKLGPGVSVGAYTIIGADVQIGEYRDLVAIQSLWPSGQRQTPALDDEAVGFDERSIDQQARARSTQPEQQLPKLHASAPTTRVGRAENSRSMEAVLPRK